MGLLVNRDKVDLNKERMNVTSIMIFTSLLGHFSLKISPCVDGEIFSILVSEEPSVSMETAENTKSESNFSTTGSRGDMESEPEGEWEGYEEAVRDVESILFEKKEMCSEGNNRDVSTKDIVPQFFAKSSKDKSVKENENLIKGRTCKQNPFDSSMDSSYLETIYRVACSIGEDGSEQERGRWIRAWRCRERRY